MALRHQLPLRSPHTVSYTHLFIHAFSILRHQLYLIIVQPVQDLEPHHAHLQGLREPLCSAVSAPWSEMCIRDRYNFNFQKKFGQNFLIDTGILEEIIDSAGITKDDMILEICLLYTSRCV